MFDFLKKKKVTYSDEETGIPVTTDKEPSKFANMLAENLATTSKQLIWIYTLNGIAWIWCSYFLAFAGHDQIAESLSSSVCTVVIGQIGFYLVTKTVENVFKYNNIIGPWRTGDKESDKSKKGDNSNGIGSIDIPNVPEPVVAEPDDAGGCSTD